MELTCESVDWIKQIALPSVVVFIQPTEGLSRQKGVRKGEFGLAACL